jgi:hypothetical protein
MPRILIFRSFASISPPLFVQSLGLMNLITH